MGFTTYTLFIERDLISNIIRAIFYGLSMPLKRRSKCPVRCEFLLRILTNVGSELLNYLVERRIDVGRLRVVDPVRIESWIHILDRS